MDDHHADRSIVPLRERLDALARAIDEDEGRQLLTYRLFEPAADTTIERVRRFLTDALDRPLGLSGGVEDFYRVTNGLQLRWIDRDNGFMDLPYDPDRDVFDPEPKPWGLFLNEDVGRSTPCGWGVASVMILPLELTFFSRLGRYEAEITDLLGEDVGEDVSKFLFNFNYFDCDHCHALDLYHATDAPPRVIEAFDRYNQYQLLIAETFDAYIERVLRFEGLYEEP